ncbi:DUF7523 family protein [Halorarius halobius]|uniref:DUF7523 family protein n=1 Tax=Halorarius halobius TaxID=2962671 RepID=UPI0020CE0605|nr:hypothetical protein [Halorarius halobius]
MTVASEAREALRREPFLHEALRAGVLNYTAAARHLDVGDEEAVAAALRRYAADLPDPEERTGSVRVEMQSGLGDAQSDEALLTVGDRSLAPGGGEFTALVARGDATAADLGEVVTRLSVEGVDVVAAGAVDGYLLVVVDRRAGVDALRHVEDALGA